VSGFVAAVALGLVAAVLLPGGLLHLARLRTFTGTIRAHGVLAPAVAAPAAVVVALAETGIGAAALLAAVRGQAPLPLLAAAALLGATLTGYVWVLRRRPDPGVDCGCTPLPAPISAASLLPGGVLAAVAGTALVASAVVPVASGVSGGGPGSGGGFGPPWTFDGPGAVAALWAFGLLWGGTLAVLVVLVPASTPRVATDGGG
jgi:hypothetical protein